MGFVSFAGRVLFAAAFLLFAYQESGAALVFLLASKVLGGGESKTVASPALMTGICSGRTSDDVGPPVCHTRQATNWGYALAIVVTDVVSGIVLLCLAKLTSQLKHVIAATVALKSLGGLLFILSSSLGAFLLLIYLAFVTPIVYNFYNYDIESAEFVQLFMNFTQNWALVGALLFLLGMKNSIPTRQSVRKKTPKSKAN